MKFPLYIGLTSLGMLLAGTIASAQQGGETATPDESGEYPAVFRIEVIVFRHAEGRSDRIRAAEPTDYTDHVDPLLVAAGNELAEQRLAELARVGPPFAISSQINETTPFLETEDETIRPIPPAYAALGDLSPPVQSAMTRLIDAAAYEPVVARAWMQTAPPGQRAAPVRVHDQTVVDVIEPDDAQSLVPMPPVLPFGPPLETPPPALDVYRLDGTFGLRQRQFLHLDLDLAWQTRARPLTGRMARADESAAATIDPETAEGEWQLHRLQQSRIVRPGRFEYFDSSLIGVLVRIERFEQVVPKIEIPEPEPPAAGADSTESPGSPEIVDPVTNSY